MIDGIRILKDPSVTKEELIAKYKNDKDLDAILNLFDSIDAKRDIPYAANYERRVSLGEYNISILRGKIQALDFNEDKYITDAEIDYFLENRGKELNTTPSAFKKILLLLSEQESSEIEQYAKEKNIPLETACMLYARGLCNAKPIELNNETFYKRGTDDNYRIYNNNGELVESYETGVWSMDERTGESYDVCKSVKIDNGIWCYESTNSETGVKELSIYDGNTETVMKNIIKNNDMLIEEIDVNGKLRLNKIQLHDEFGGTIDIELRYDENGKVNGVDTNSAAGQRKIKLKKSDITAIGTISEPTEPPTVSEESLLNLMTIINNGNVAHKDFDMKFENGEINFIPRYAVEVLDDNAGSYKYEDSFTALPSFMKMKMADFLKHGFKAGTDYKITPNSIEYLSGKMLDYECFNKIEFYDENGNITDESKNYVEAPGLIGFSSFDENNVYPQHNASKTPSAELIPQIQRTKVSENSFTEAINGIKYEVKFDNNILKIKKGGNELSMDLNYLDPKFVKNMLMQVNAEILYNLAKSKTVIQLKDMSENGTYEPQTNTLSINKHMPNMTEFLRVIAHECGHLVDSKDDKQQAIEFIKDMIKTKPSLAKEGLSMDKLLDKYGTRQLQSPLNQKLINTINKELQKNLNIQSGITKHYKESFGLPFEVMRVLKDYDDTNLLYALETVEEFFAEAYSLLTTGNCKSASLLCNYFPESLKLVKQIIEENEK